MGDIIFPLPGVGIFGAALASGTDGGLFARPTGLTPDDLVDPMAQQPVAALVLDR